METRTLGKTGFEIKPIGLGTWQVGGRWGEPFSDANADEIINTAIDLGVNFIDTADVYSDGLSEQAVGRVVRSRSENVFVATKCGRQINPHVSEGYQPEVLRKFVEASLERMGLKVLDLIQIHCPPNEVFYRDEIFEAFEKMKADGLIRNYGVSVETTAQAIKSMEYPGVSSIQIIFNIFRQKPAREVLDLAAQNDVGILARVPLASGLLTGKFNRNSVFGKDDHRNFNRNGEVFDKGETFSGVDYELGLQAVEQLSAKLDSARTLSELALLWVLSHPAVSCVIPGASSINQLLSNWAVGEKAPLTSNEIQACNSVYDQLIKQIVEEAW